MYRLTLLSKSKLFNKVKSNNLSNLAHYSNYNSEPYFDDFDDFDDYKNYKDNKNKLYDLVYPERIACFSGSMCNECKGMGWVVKENDKFHKKYKLSSNIEFNICINCNGTGYL